MKKIVLLTAVFVSIAGQFCAQSPSLPECIEKARQHSAVSAQVPLLKATLDAQQALASGSYLPKLSLNGSATWQSEVTSLPISIPGIELQPPPQDQYKLTLDLQQNIWDGGLASAQKMINQQQSALELAKTDQDLYLLKEQVAGLYFGAALAGDQLENVRLLKAQVAARLEKTRKNLAFGTAIPSQVRLFEARLIELEQQENDLLLRKQSLLRSLSLLMGEDLPATFRPEIDLNYTASTSDELQRPELRVFQHQHDLAHANKKLVSARYMPKFSAIGTLGYGRPGLNFLETEFGPYAVVGLNFRVPLDHFYSGSAKQEQALLDLQAARADLLAANFSTQQRLKVQAQRLDIERLAQSVASDERLVDLKTAIKTTAASQLDDGIITPSDFLEELNNELIARQNQATHRLQLAYAKVQLDLLLGRF